MSDPKTLNVFILDYNFLGYGTKTQTTMWYVQFVAVKPLKSTVDLVRKAWLKAF